MVSNRGKIMKSPVSAKQRAVANLLAMSFEVYSRLIGVGSNAMQEIIVIIKLSIHQLHESQSDCQKGHARRNGATVRAVRHPS